MENPRYVNYEIIPLVTHHDKDREGDHDNDQDDNNTPNTIKVDEITFMTPITTNKQATSTLGLKEKVK